MALTDALLLDPYPLHKWVALRTDSQAGTGTLNDPLNASTPEQFDSVMNNIQAQGPTMVHLGPGTFQTHGYYDGGAFTGYGWQAKPGMRIVGSGMDVTTLKLVINAATSGHFYAIGHALTVSQGGAANLADFLEISDLTIDCNGGQGTGSRQARCGAIRIMGNHVRIARVKVVNWGSMGSNLTCFAIALVTADPSSGVSGVSNAGIENCILLNPVSATTGPAVALHAGPKEDITPLPTIEAYGSVPYIRNCFVDYGTLDTNPLHGHRALSMGWCLGGNIQGNQIYNVTHGGLFLQQSSIRDFTIRDNFFKNVYKGLFFQPAVASAKSGSVQRSGTTATVTCSNHNLGVGDRVQIVHGTGQAQDFDGIHEVTYAESGLFTFATSATIATSVNVTAAKVYGAGKLLLEGNEIELAPATSGELIGIHLHDAALLQDQIYPAYVHGDAVIRNNRIRYLNSQFETNYVGYGIQANGVKRLIVRDQVLELTAQPNPPLQNHRCG